MENYTWFKFSPAQWFMGKIQRCSLEAQAAYIRLSCIYWNKGGDMSIDEAKDEVLDSYSELLRFKVIQEDQGYIVISFLDAQLEEIAAKHFKRVEAGRKGGKAKASKAKAMPINARQSKSKSKQVIADKIREEKNRIEKNREEKKREEKKRDVVFPFDGLEFMNLWEQWKQYKSKEHNFKYKSIQSEQAGLNKLAKLSNGNEQKAIQIIVQSLENGWKGLFDVKQSNNKTNGDTEVSADWLAGR